MFSHDEVRLTVIHSGGGGIAGIKFSELPEEIQRKYNYDPEEAQRVKAQREQEKEERERAVTEAQARRAQQVAINQRKAQETARQYRQNQARKKYSPKLAEMNLRRVLKWCRF